MSPATTKRKRKKLERLVVTDVAALKALADPMRLHVLVELSDQARTVKEVASILGVKPTRLYYHFKMLEKAGLITVVDRRMVSGIEERTYETVADNVTPAPESLTSLVKEGIIGAFFKVIRAELELAALSAPEPVGDLNGPVPMLALTTLQLSPEQVEEVQERLVSIMQDFGSGAEASPDARTYHYVLGGYLAPSELQRGRNKD